MTPHDEPAPKIRDKPPLKKEDKDIKVTGEEDTKKDPPSPYAKYAAPDARIWGMYLEEAEAEDKELMEPWNKDLDSLLVFVGRFHLPLIELKTNPRRLVCSRVFLQHSLSKVAKIS